MKKKFLSILLATAMVVMCACGAGGNEQGGNQQSGGDADIVQKVDDWEYGPNSFGGAVKYDPDKPVNNGEPITIEYWLWTGDAIFGDTMNRYMEIHPNVTIEIVNNPFDDYWVKLPLALSGSDGPALFNLHGSMHNNFINYLAPYDIPTEDLMADFQNVDLHLIDGEIYYLDTGFMTGSIFYNVDMWEEAGLTDEDIPKTWDEFIEIAKKLTVRDESGKLLRAGWNFNSYVNSNYLLGLNYQLGQNLFEDDMVTADINNDAQKQVMQMLIDAYDVHGVGHKDFGQEALVSFATGQTAMISSWGWLNDYMLVNFPDINFGVFEIPTFTEEPYAYNRLGVECTFGINKNADPAQQEVAQDIVRFLLADDESLLNLALGQSVFPSKYSLQDNPRVLENKALAAIADHIDQYVFTGNFPAAFETYLLQAEQNIFFNGMSVDEALQLAEDQINADLLDADFTSLEDQYNKK